MGFKVESHKRILISFSGIDGAGKSTQIENLSSELLRAGLTVQTITFWDDIAQLKFLREEVGHKVFRGDRGVGSPEAPIVRRDKNVRTPLVTIFRLGVYLLDAFSLRIRAFRARRSGAHVVIFDRYLYDELANLDLHRTFFRLYVLALLRLIPKPDVPFLLDADPSAAFARKPEYPLEFLHSNRAAYLQLASSVQGIRVVPPLPLQDALAEVSRLFWDSVPAREVRRLAEMQTSTSETEKI